MKKRFFPILFLFLMVFSTTAYAASTRAATVTPNISFHGTTANCSVFIVADKRIKKTIHKNVCSAEYNLLRFNVLKLQTFVRKR